MSKDQKLKPTVMELYKHMAKVTQGDWLVLPVALSDHMRAELSHDHETFVGAVALESAYIIHASAGLIHGADTKGLYDEMQDIFKFKSATIGREATPRNALEVLKKDMKTYYPTHGITCNEGNTAGRFEALDKYAHFFASSIYPDVPKWKPSVEKIHVLLQEVQEKNKTADKNKMYFPSDNCALNKNEWQVDRLLEVEFSYVEAAVIHLIHGTYTPDLFGTPVLVSGSKDREDCRAALKELYAELGITTGPTTCAEQFKTLDRIAENFARRIYPDLPKGKI